MTERKDSFEFELSEPLKYHHSGNEETGNLLVLKAPSLKQNGRRIKLQQTFFQAVQSMRSKNPHLAEQEDEDQQDKEITGPEVLAMLLASDADMVSFHEEFEKLMCSGTICMIEDQEKMTKVIWEKLHYDDVDALLGEYMANFIVASVLKTLSKK